MPPAKKGTGVSANQGIRKRRAKSNKNSTAAGEPTARKKRETRIWTDRENRIIIDYLLNAKQKGFLKMVKAETLYSKMLEKNRKEQDESRRLPSDITPSLMVHHIQNLIRKYKKTVLWTNQTGQGVRTDSGEETFKTAILNQCQYYYELEEIYGERTDVRPPKTHETTQIGPPASKRPREEPQAEHEPEPGDQQQLQLSPFRVDEPDGLGDDPLWAPNDESDSDADEIPLRVAPSIAPRNETTGQGGNVDNSRPGTSQSARQSLLLPPPSRPADPREKNAHPGRRLDTAAERLAKIGKKTPREVYEDIVNGRGLAELERIELQRDQLAAQQKQIDADIQLKRDMFEYQKDQDKQKFELQSMEIRALELKLELKRLEQNNVVNNN